MTGNIDDIWLYGAGLLRTGQKDVRTVHLPEAVKILALRLLASGGRLLRKLAETEQSDTILLAEAYGLVQWERDSRGRNGDLVLTWRGQELAELLLIQARALQQPRQHRHG